MGTLKRKNQFEAAAAGNIKLFGGLTNAISYKNLEFSFMFQFVTGVDLYFQTGEFLANSGILNLGQLADQSNRWYASGDDAPNPVLNPNNDFPLPIPYC